MARRDTRADPFVQSSYYVELVIPSLKDDKNDGRVGYFGRVTGGSISITVIEYTLNQYGGSQGIYIPGATAFEPVTLSQGVGTNMNFWKWWGDIAGGKNISKLRLNASVLAYGPLTKEITAALTDEVKADASKGVEAQAAGLITATEAKTIKKYAEWSLIDVWPAKISGFNFAATGDRTFGISVTLMAEEISRVQ